MTIAVFTKNSTNPAYESFRIGADKIAQSVGARTVHYVPKTPDNVAEQKAFVEQALKDRPDIVIFIPVDDVAMVESLKKLNDANIPVVVAGNTLPGRSPNSRKSVRACDPAKLKKYFTSGASGCDLMRCGTLSSKKKAMNAINVDGRFAAIERVVRLRFALLTMTEL